MDQAIVTDFSVVRSDLYRGRGVDFSMGGGGVTRCHTQGTYQIGMSTPTPSVTKGDIFCISSERRGGGGTT